MPQRFATAALALLFGAALFWPVAAALLAVEPADPSTGQGSTGQGSTGKGSTGKGPTGKGPAEEWSGKIADEASLELAPEAGFVADEESWKELWTAWRPDEDAPVVDFAEELVLVGTVPGPNRVLMRPKLEDDGDVRFAVGGTKVGGPGFGYKLVRFSREGVKTVNGKPIDAGGVHGLLEIPGNVGSFDGHRLEIKLWEYDPLLADVGATLIDEFSVEKYGHKEGTTTKTPFAVGADLEPRDDRRYYITVFVLKDGKRTHMGEKDGKSGLCNVLTQGNPSSVKMIARSVR